MKWKQMVKEITVSVKSAITQGVSGKIDISAVLSS